MTGEVVMVPPVDWNNGPPGSMPGERDGLRDRPCRMMPGEGGGSGIWMLAISALACASILAFMAA